MSPRIVFVPWAVMMLAPLAVASQISPKDRIVKKFCSRDYGDVRAAEMEFEKMGPRRAIPILLEILDRDIEAPLTNTADQIYPGAKNFYGHGLLTPYELDWIPARAGARLEAYFQKDFGFRALGVNEEELLETAVTTGMKTIPMHAVSGGWKTPSKADYLKAVQRVKQYWKEHRGTWSEVEAFTEGLSGHSTWFQLGALSILRNDWILDRDPPSPEIDAAFYDRLFPLIVALLDSPDPDIRSQAAQDVRGEYLERGLWKLDKRINDLLSRQVPTTSNIGAENVFGQRVQFQPAAEFGEEDRVLEDVGFLGIKSLERDAPFRLVCLINDKRSHLGPRNGYIGLVIEGQTLRIYSGEPAEEIASWKTFWRLYGSEVRKLKTRPLI